MLVAVMTASSVKKLPKVIWPIESEYDRIRYKIDAKIDDMTEKTGLKDPVYTTDFAAGGTCEAHPGGTVNPVFRPDMADFRQVPSGVLPAGHKGFNRL
jgi:hypothetical protein